MALFSYALRAFNLLKDKQNEYPILVLNSFSLSDSEFIPDGQVSSHKSIR